MSDYNIFLFISVVTTFVKVTVGLELEDYKLYAIQNADDNTYLKALNNGEICDRRGDVVTSRNLDQGSHAYRWMHKSLLTGRVHLEVDSHDFKINEITMQETPPNCYSAFAEYELAHVNEDTFRIKNWHNKKCLTANGMNHYIVWDKGYRGRHARVSGEMSEVSSGILLIWIKKSCTKGNSSDSAWDDLP